MEDFAAVLIQARRRTGLTQAQVATVAGLTPSYLSLLENRKKPPPSDEVCRSLAVALRISAKRLLDLAHIQRAPESVRTEVRSLRHSLKRERRSRTRASRALLSPFLFAGPPGYLESALDTLQISPARRRRLRAALDPDALRHKPPRDTDSPTPSAPDAAGRPGTPANAPDLFDLSGNQDEPRDPRRRAELVARLIDRLSERDRAALLEALPQLLDEQFQDHVDDLAADRESAGRRGDTRGAKSTEDGEAGRAFGSPPFLYGPPPADAMPAGPYLIEAAGPDLFWPDSIREHDLLLIDPGAVARPGDLVFLRGGETGRIRRLEEVGSARIESARRFALRGPGSDPAGPAPLEILELERYVANESAGTVIEIRRPLRPRAAVPPGSGSGSGSGSGAPS